MYPAKLIVNGKLVRDEFPDWVKVLHRSRTTELLILTNIISESSLGTRDSLNINQERVDAAESIISDRSSYAHGIDEDMETCETQISCDPLIAELNMDLPSESDASVSIHKAEFHATNSAHSVASYQEFFFCLIIWMTQLRRYTFMNFCESHERMSRSIECGNRCKPSLSLSESRLTQASRVIKQPKQSNTVLLVFSLTVKAAPYECVIRTSLP